LLYIHEEREIREESLASTMVT